LSDPSKKVLLNFAKSHYKKSCIKKEHLRTLANVKYEISS